MAFLGDDSHATVARRLVLVLALLGAASTRAHSIDLRFTSPVGPQNVARGSFRLAWTEYAETFDATPLSFFAAFGGLELNRLPTPQHDVAVTLAPVRLDDPANALEWQTDGLPAGCYQPYLRIEDPQEGTAFYPAAGMISVVGPDGNVPPTVWIHNAPEELQDDDGRVVVRVEAFDPDDVTLLSVHWLHENGTRGEIVSDHPVAPGTPEQAFTFNVRGLPEGVVFLRAEVVSGDTRRCAAFWNSFLWISRQESLATPPDAGPGDDTAPPPQRRGCSSGNTSSPESASGLLPLLGLALLTFVSRRPPPVLSRSSARPSRPG